MPKADTTPTTTGATTPASTRRQLLGGAALAALTGGAFGAAIALPDAGDAAPATFSPDAELLAACASFDALEADYRATDFASDTRSAAGVAADAERDRIATAQLLFVERMIEHQAVTPAGYIARARSLLRWKPEMAHENGDVGDVLISALLRDLVGGA